MILLVYFAEIKEKHQKRLNAKYGGGWAPKIEG